MEYVRIRSTLNMRVALMLVGVFLSSAALLADDHIVQFDTKVDFASIRTFTFRNRGVEVNRPELNNTIVISALTDSIRRGLTARTLTETTNDPDVFVDFVVGGQEFSVGPFGRVMPAREGRGGRRGRAGEPTTGDRVAFVEGVLVLDIVARQSGLLIWRGVYRDSERDTAKLAQKLPSDAGKLLSEFPPKRP